MANINKELNSIKRGIYGREVRDAIHDGIKKAYDDASVGGNANMEIAAARGGEKVLNDRLNKMDSDNNKIFSLKADKSALSSGLNKKRDNNVEIGMSDFDQETREAFTGGSVAVVGVDSVGVENLRENAVTRNKIDNLALSNIPWITGEYENLNYVWDTGSSIVDSKVINNPLPGQGFLTVEQTKTLSNSTTNFVKQTISAIGVNPMVLSRVISVNASTGTLNNVRNWITESNEDIKDGSIIYEKLANTAKEKIINNVNKNLGYSVSNINWAQLQNNYIWVEGEFVHSTGDSYEYRTNHFFKRSVKIPVDEGDTWKVSSRDLFSEWSSSSRGVLIDENDNVVESIPIDDENTLNTTSTFKIPKGVKYMIVTARLGSEASETHLLKLCDWKNIWSKSNYTLDSYIDNNGVIRSTSEKWGYQEKLWLMKERYIVLLMYTLVMVYLL